MYCSDRIESQQTLMFIVWLIVWIGYIRVPLSKLQISWKCSYRQNIKPLHIIVSSCSEDTTAPLVIPNAKLVHSNSNVLGIVQTKNKKTQAIISTKKIS